jgi:hypothetical protein
MFGTARISLNYIHFRCNCDDLTISDCFTLATNIQVGVTVLLSAAFNSSFIYSKILLPIFQPVDIPVLHLMAY